VIAAPYHRLADGIIADHRIFASPPDAARGILARFGATYVVMCGNRAPPEMSGQDRKPSLWGQLQAATPPSWLVPVPSAPGDAFRVYRIVAHAR